MLGLGRVDGRDDILVLGTDNLFDWSLKEMVLFAKDQVPSSTVAVRAVGSLKEASRCAVVELDDKAKLISCVEKPKEPASLIAALCIYYFPASIRQRLDEFINAGKNVDAPGFFIEWLSKQETVYGFMTKGEWFDVGSQESYDQVCRHWKDKYAS
jgi:glucose-1-phosphate thymidylyltransferase